MRKIPESDAALLYDAVEEITQSEYTPKELVPKLRVVLENLFKFLTRDATEQFSNLYGRMMFIQNNFLPPQALVGELHAFRSYANKVVHEADYVPGEEEFKACVRIISEAISHFSGVELPEFHQKLIASASEARLPGKESKNEKRVGLLDVTVISFSEIKTSRNGGRYCSLICNEPNRGRVDVIFRDFDEPHFGARLSEIGKQVWKYARLYLYNLKQDEQKKHLYLSTPSTFYVLEPDYLIQATDVARCFEGSVVNPHMDLLNRFTPSEVGKFLLVGSVVNFLLDELVRAPDSSLDEIFAVAMNEYALDLIALSKKYNVAWEDAANSLREAVQRHGKTIREFVLARKHERVLIEPTFYAPFYGLTGRLDLLIEDKEHDNRKDIVELKSGQPPDLYFKNGVKPEHEAQTHCYALMLLSTYPKWRGSSSILYSTTDAESQPLREVHCHVADKQNLLRVRNQIVSHDFRLARGDFGPLEAVASGNMGETPHYRDVDRAIFGKVFTSAPPEERAWFKAYISFLLRELRSAKTGSDTDDSDGGHAMLWRASLREKQDKYAILFYLEIDFEESDFERFHIWLKADNLLNAQYSNFRKGDIVVLYPVDPKEKHHPKPYRYQILKCYIKEMAPGRVLISLRNKQFDADYFKKYAFWAIEPDFMEKSYRTLFQSLYGFMTSTNQRVRDLLMGRRAPTFADELPKPCAPEGLTPEQTELLNRALRAKDFFLLQGPPGAGKTSVVLKNMVDYLHRYTEEKVLLLAFTNRAVDEICEKVRELGLQFFRVGFGKSGEENNWKTLVREKNFDQIHEFLEGTRIFISTVSSFHSNAHKIAWKAFDTAIVDEASQLLEPHLAGVLVQTRRFVLIGDEKQLPAVVTQPESQCQLPDDALKKTGARSLSGSLFERLLHLCETNGWTDAFGMLSTHGRMHEETARFVNEQFYDRKLKVYDKGRQKAPLRWFRADAESELERQLASGRLAYFCSHRETRSKINELEARQAGSIARIIYQRAKELDIPFDEKTLGIITPFRAQIDQIKRRLSPEIEPLVLVDTVERFQGSEREIIIVSMAVNNHFQLRNVISLTPDEKVDRKLNVALTRAREHTIFIGCGATLDEGFHFQQLAQFARERGAYFELPRPEIVPQKGVFDNV